MYARSNYAWWEKDVCVMSCYITNVILHTIIYMWPYCDPCISSVAIQDLLSPRATTRCRTYYIFHITDRSLEKFICRCYRRQEFTGDHANWSVRNEFVNDNFAAGGINRKNSQTYNRNSWDRHFWQLLSVFWIYGTSHSTSYIPRGAECFLQL